jgi:hypothetical protein
MVVGQNVKPGNVEPHGRRSAVRVASVPDATRLPKEGGRRFAQRAVVPALRFAWGANILRDVQRSSTTLVLHIERRALVEQSRSTSEPCRGVVQGRHGVGVDAVRSRFARGPRGSDRSQ